MSLPRDVFQNIKRIRFAETDSPLGSISAEHLLPADSKTLIFSLVSVEGIGIVDI